MLIDRVRRAEPDAWDELIARFEGRILAFVESRLRNRSLAEDVVQETFIGFLTSLPNYDRSRPLESYLFSIAAHKLTDALRREGRRPTVPLSPGSSGNSQWDVPGPAAAGQQHHGQRRAPRSGGEGPLPGDARNRSSTGASGATGRRSSAWSCCWCAAGATRKWPRQLGITEQQVANFKFDFLARLRGRTCASRGCRRTCFRS